MSTAAPAGEKQLRLLREAADWRLIGLLLECPGSGWLEEVTALAHESGDSLLRDAAAHAAREATEGLYHSVFGPGGPAPPREVSYRDSVELGYLMSELAAHYDAFAFKPATPEVPDHVSVEAGFVGYLRFKEAFALAKGDAEHAAITAEAAGGFVREHVSRMAGPLAGSLAQSGIAYLELAARALLERTGPPPSKQPVRPALDILQSITSEESAFDCGDDPVSL